MTTEVYEYVFSADVAIEEAEASLLLALMATASLHGECEVRLNAAHVLDRDQRLCLIDATTELGKDLNRLFVGFLSREFGPESFTVERIVGDDLPQQETAA